MVAQHRRNDFKDTKLNIKNQQFESFNIKKCTLSDFNEISKEVNALVLPSSNVSLKHSCTKINFITTALTLIE